MKNTNTKIEYSDEIRDEVQDEIYCAKRHLYHVVHALDNDDWRRKNAAEILQKLDLLFESV